ncbi:Bcr/CflA subfamily drug resistance transporter [Croceibacterium mercuriale]|uniref:Bcr/CflA subfamily drug resistance transporter n=1 Tax=Croceibacterium mercuriale TaxID=1572751 RepID=A0A0B2C2T6_9SPHN|nr:multidrug effflux MFS transporter [Croceibacterium mercuriale]KHL26485.1 Bcr/CflA subfamily drug resistance transporter [Croceibacterium mercuriale]
MATSAATPHNKIIGQRELVVIVALLMSLNALAIDAMLPALGQMAAELNVQDGNRRQLVVAVYLLANGLGCLLPGSLADRFGRRPVLFVSLAAYAACSLLIAAIHSFEVLLALRGIQGVLCAGLMVVPTAIIRDQYEGDKMARLMSLVSAVFITVPVIAPSLGQGVLLFAGWRWIFILFAVVAAVTGLWVWLRLPETLHPENRQRVELPVVLRNMRTGLLNRGAIGYVLGAGLLVGAVFGYVNSAQQLLGEHFGVGEWFPLVFGGTAAMMAVSNIVNSRIVERFGARRVSHAGVLTFIVVSAAQVWAAHYRPGELAVFLPLMATNLMLLGFLGANFGSIAMQPFARIAGAASSVQTFCRMFGAAVVGLLIGQAYDGSARPFAHALLMCSVSALVLVLFSEKGRLFRRLNPPRQQQPAGPPPV